MSKQTLLEIADMNQLVFAAIRSGNMEQIHASEALLRRMDSLLTGLIYPEDREDTSKDAGCFTLKPGCDGALLTTTLLSMMGESKAVMEEIEANQIDRSEYMDTQRAWLNSLLLRSNEQMQVIVEELDGRGIAS